MKSTARVQARFLRTLLASAIAGIATVPAVWAQGADLALEEVIVTAQKREQSLQDTPISISTLDAGDLEQLRFTDMNDIGGYVPNLQLASTSGDTTGTSVGMRGTVTVNNNINFEPTVGMYLDGVIIAKSAANVFDIVDLQRIEVLRGPQGTLYGKNTIGGAINFVSKLPEEQFGADVKLGFGNYGEQVVQGSVDTGAMGSDGQFRAEFTLRNYQRDGIVENRTFELSPYAEPASKGDFGERDDDAGRAVLQWIVSEEWDALYSYDFAKNERIPPFVQVDTITANGIFDPTGYLCSPAPIPNACYADTQLINYKDDSGRADKGSNNWALQDDSDVDGHTLTIKGGEFDAGALGTIGFKSITAYRNTDTEARLDLDGSNVDIARFLRRIDYEQTSQEFQFTGTAGNLNYVLGLYYFKEEGEVYNPGWFFGYYESIFGYPVNPALNTFEMDNDASAVYGQFDWRPADGKLLFTLGGRYTSEQKDMSMMRQESYGSYSVPAGTRADDEYTDFSPMGSVSWDVTENTTLYAKVAKGFKSGGFNTTANTVESFLRGFDSEEMLSYELGWKSELLERRVRLNGALFYSEYTEMQLSNYLPSLSGGAISFIDNAGEATIQGAEVELVGVLTENLQLTASYGYLDGEYEEYKVYDPTLGREVDVKDDRELPFQPDTTASLALDYQRQLGDIGLLSARLAWNYGGSYYIYPENAETTKADNHDVVNARIGVSEIETGCCGSLEVALWGKNLTDEEYRVHGIDFGAFGYAFKQWADPLTYGVEATYHFE